MRIADFGESLRHREYVKVGWFAVRNLVPVKGCGYTRIGDRAYGIPRACCPVLRVLVVIEEHAVTLFFPPLRASQRGHPSLDCTREGERRASYFTKGPDRLNPHVDMHTPRAARFGPPL